MFFGLCTLPENKRLINLLLCCLSSWAADSINNSRQKYNLIGGSNDNIWVPEVWEDDERQEEQQDGDAAADEVDVAENDRLTILLLSVHVRHHQSTRTVISYQ